MSTAGDFRHGCVEGDKEVFSFYPGVDRYDVQRRKNRGRFASLGLCEYLEKFFKVSELPDKIKNLVE